MVQNLDFNNNFIDNLDFITCLLEKHRGFTVPDILRKNSLQTFGKLKEKVDRSINLYV